MTIVPPTSHMIHRYAHPEVDRPQTRGMVFDERILVEVGEDPSFDAANAKVESTTITGSTYKLASISYTNPSAGQSMLRS